MLIFNFLGLVLFLSISGFLMIAIHEFGHFLAARLVGLSCSQVKVGPVRWQHEKQQWRMSWDNDWNWGYVKVAEWLSGNTRLQMIIVLLGGAAANVIIALFCAAFIWQQPEKVQVSSVWTFPLFLFAILSALSGLGNLWPFRVRKIMMSDGLWLWTFCRSQKVFEQRQREWQEYYSKVEQWQAVKALQENMVHNVAPRNWNENQVRQAVTRQDGDNIERYGLCYAYLWAADTGNVLAEQFLDRLLKLPEIEPPQRPFWLIEKSFWIALRSQDAEAARQWLAQAGEHQHTSEYWRACAAIALAEGRDEEAACYLQQAEALWNPQDTGERLLLNLLRAQRDQTTDVSEER